MYCTKCGAKTKEDSKFCTVCGTAIPQPNQQKQVEVIKPVKEPVHAVNHDVQLKEASQEQFSQQKESKIKAVHSRTKGILIVLISLLLIAVGVGAFFIIRNYINSNHNDNRIDVTTMDQDEAEDATNQEALSSPTPELEQSVAQMQITKIDKDALPKVTIYFTLTDNNGASVSNVKAEELTLSEWTEGDWMAVGQIDELIWLQTEKQYSFTYQTSKQPGWCDVLLEFRSEEYTGEDEDSYMIKADKEGAGEEAVQDDIIQDNTASVDTVPQETVDNSIIVSATASSELATQSDNGGDYDYYANNVIDANPETAWVEGVDGNGEGEWIQFDFDDVHSLNGIEISNGYQKSEYVYGINGRPKDIRISFSDQSFEDFTLSDNYNEIQKLGFIKTHRSQYIRIEILTVYEGTKYPDTCITDLAIY